MEEINEIHSTSLEWGAITNLIDRISTIEEGIDGGWDELAIMLSDMMSEEGQSTNPEKIFFNVYQYVFRLYYRLRSNPIKREFNTLSKNKNSFRITNYDYKTFKWAIEGGFIMSISNDYIDLPADKLTPNQIKAFKRRLEKGNK